MRISSTLFFQTGLNSINAQQSDLMHLFQQIGSGRRMVTPADDPLAAAQAVNISQAQSLNQRFAGNRDVAMQNLGVEDNTLNSLTLLVQDIKTRMVEVGNGSLSDADRMTLANVLSNAKTSLAGLANATDGNGQYLFSGSKGNTAPFADNGSGSFSYVGDSLQRNIQIDQTRQVAGSDIGSDVFMRATPGTRTYLTSAGSTNGGTGVIGSPTVIDAAAAKLGHSYEITFTAADMFTVTVKDTAGNVVGTPLVDQPYQGPDETSVTLPHGVQVKLAGQPQAGDSFQVSRPGAGPAASADMNIFDTLENLISVLEVSQDADPVAQANFRNVLASSMQRIDLNYDNILTVRASVGARMNEIGALDANGTLRNLGFKAQLSQLEDVDYYSATTQLELRKSALEAAALAFRKIQGTSLFNMGSS